VLAVIYGVPALCLPLISYVDPIHIRDERQMRDTNAMDARRRVGGALVIGSARNGRFSKSHLCRKLLSGLYFQSLHIALAAKPRPSSRLRKIFPPARCSVV